MALVPESDQREGSRDDDAPLVEAIRRGEMDAFADLVRKYQHGVVGLAQGLLPDRADAEDVAQESFLRAYRGLGRFRGASRFRTWLFQIVINTARTYRSRQRARHQIAPAADELDALPVNDRMEATIVMRDHLSRALATLPPELREAVVLRDVEGLDYREIAQALSVPIGTVESRIFRGRRQLRAALGGRRPGEQS